MVSALKEVQASEGICRWDWYSLLRRSSLSANQEEQLKEYIASCYLLNSITFISCVWRIRRALSSFVNSTIAPNNNGLHLILYNFPSLQVIISTLLLLYFTVALLLFKMKTAKKKKWEESLHCRHQLHNVDLLCYVRWHIWSDRATIITKVK